MLGRDQQEAGHDDGNATASEDRGPAVVQPFDYASARAQAPGLELGLNAAASGGGRRGRGRGRGGRDAGGRGRGVQLCSAIDVAMRQQVAAVSRCKKLCLQCLWMWPAGMALVAAIPQSKSDLSLLRLRGSRAVRSC